MDRSVLVALRRQIRTWGGISSTLLLGCAWLILLCLPFVSPGDHLWQQEVLQYQGFLALALLLIIPLATPLGIMVDRRWWGLLAFGLTLGHGLGAFKHTFGADLQGWQFLSPMALIALVLGVLSLLLMIPLTLTSNNWSVARLGAAWKTLHRSLFYPVLILAVVHTVAMGVHFQSSSIQGQINTLLLGGLTSGLLFWRWRSHA